MSEDDFSEKSLNLTTCAIRYNPFNYNFWIFRRKILARIPYDPFKELCLLEELIVENPKNFQSWEHRRIIINKNLSCCTSAQELKLTEHVLLMDPKNYSAWTHRQFIVNSFKYTNLGLLGDEMRFTSKMIKDDIRNNSAWNQRFFIVNQRGRTDPVLVKNELRFALDKIKLANENDSAWNYMRGLLLNFEVKKLWQFQELVDYCEQEFYENENTNRHIVAFILDLKIEMVLDDSNDANELLLTQKVFNLCQALGSKYDKIRKSYWNYVYKQFCYDKIIKRDSMCDSFNNAGGVTLDDSWKYKLAKKVGGIEISVKKETSNGNNKCRKHRK